MKRETMHSRHGRLLSTGFTLVELIVVIGVIGIVCGLLFPAIVASRESARVVHCQNNLRQLAVGVIESESTFKRYPSSGWGWRWVADPDRGFGASQPGSWIYQILPFIEQQSTQNIGKGSATAVKRLELAMLTEQSLSIVRCPSRSGAELCPIDPNISWRNAELSTGFARTDYVGNGGSIFPGVVDGPNSIEEGDSFNYAWPSTSKIDGIFFQRSGIRSSMITDGHSNTYLLGGKYVAKSGYSKFGDFGYDQPYIAGDDWDTIRWTEKLPRADGSFTEPEIFGSAHPYGYSVALCDGSVRIIDYSIESAVHRKMGSRNDGEIQSALP